MKKQTFAVIGLGRFGGSVCKTLADAGQEVLAIDKYESRVNDYKDIATQAVVADAQDEDVLRSLGIRNVDHVIVAIGEDIQASILVTLMVKEQGVKYVTAKAQNEYHAKVLEKLGVDRVVHPERDMGVRIGRSLTSKNMVDYLDLDANFKLAEILITNPEFVGKSLAEMDFRDRYGLNVIALAHSRQEMVLPSAGDVLTENDSILVAGPTRAIDKFEELMQKRNS
jgi:trk system potassium uptake protein TrkA